MKILFKIIGTIIQVLGAVGIVIFLIPAAFSILGPSRDLISVVGGVLISVCCMVLGHFIAKNKKIALISLVVYPFYLVIAMCSFVGIAGSLTDIIILKPILIWLFNELLHVLVFAMFRHVCGPFAEIIALLTWCYLLSFVFAYSGATIIEIIKSKYNEKNPVDGVPPLI